jgi:hypothetical protein
VSCKDLLVIASGLCFCFIGGEAFAFKASSFQTTQIVEAHNFYPLSSLQFHPTLSSQRISQSPSPSPTNSPNDNFSAEMEKCKGIPQVGKREFCLGQVLVKYGRLDEAKEHLRAARDMFKANGKSDKSTEVEIWARNNNVPLN